MSQDTACLRLFIKAKINSLMKKYFEKHKFCVYARLVLPLIIILASNGLVVSITRMCVCKNGPLAMWQGPQGLSWSGYASVAVDLRFQVMDSFGRACAFSLHLTKPSSLVCLR